MKPIYTISWSFYNSLLFHDFNRVEVFFIRADGTKIRGTGKVGDSLLDVVVNNSIDLEGFGACEGTLTCSTCHLIFKQEDFDQLPGKLVVNYLNLDLIHSCMLIDLFRKTRG